MIDILPEHLNIVQKAIKKWLPGARVLVFGSRVRGNAKPFSDLDIAVDNKKVIEPSVMANLKHELSESSLPIKIDLVDWYSIDKNFQQVILECFEELSI